jgi:hypothetical protein
MNAVHQDPGGVQLYVMWVCKVYFSIPPIVRPLQGRGVRTPIIPQVSPGAIHIQPLRGCSQRALNQQKFLNNDIAAAGA